MGGPEFPENTLMLLDSPAMRDDILGIPIQ